MDKCRKCGETKPINDFPKDKCAKKGYSTYCKICKRAKVKSNYYKNPEKKISKVKEWFKDNPDKIPLYNRSQKDKGYTSKYYQDNKEKLSKYNSDYSKKRREETGEYYHPVLKQYVKATPPKSPEERKLIQTYRDRVKRGIQTDRKKTFELLGCSFAELKVYIESQFYPEMDWNNWGKVWELDHIIGCINFDFNNPDELAKCFHYTNLRPLFKTTKIAESFGYNDIVGNRNRKRYH